MYLVSISRKDDLHGSGTPHTPVPGNTKSMYHHPTLENGKLKRSLFLVMKVISSPCISSHGVITKVAQITKSGKSDISLLIFLSFLHCSPALPGEVTYTRSRPPMTTLWPMLLWGHLYGPPRPAGTVGCERQKKSGQIYSWASLGILQEA